LNYSNKGEKVESRINHQCAVIKRTVAKRFNISIHDINGDSRKEEVVAARNWAICLCKEKTKATDSQIGEIFNKHRTTIIGILKNKDHYNFNPGCINLPPP
jgi:chromosomal replication initiation ATPase DnaA